MREATEPVPCPECFKDASRIMPTSFAAFTFREGYPGASRTTASTSTLARR